MHVHRPGPVVGYSGIKDKSVKYTSWQEGPDGFSWWCFDVGPRGNKCPFTSLANPSNFHRITGITGQHLPPLVYIPPFQHQRQIAGFKHFHIAADSGAVQQMLGKHHWKGHTLHSEKECSDILDALASPEEPFITDRLTDYANSQHILSNIWSIIKHSETKHMLGRHFKLSW